MGRRHIEAAQQAGFQVTAVCDMFEDAAKEAVQDIKNKPSIFTDWHTLLDEKSLFDVLVVATNGPSHHEIILKAARAEVPYLLCEKPLSTSGAKAREIVAACKKSGTKLAVNLARRYMDVSLELKKALQQDVIGKVQHFNFHIGAGGLGCIGTHYFDMPAWLLDTRPQWVSGTVDENPAPNVRGEQFFDPGGRALIGYGNGITASFECSGNATRLSRGEIIGTHGYIAFDDFAENGMVTDIYARPTKEWDISPNRFVRPELIKPGIRSAAFDIVEPTRRCLEDLVGKRVEDTSTGGIDAVDAVIGIHLSAQKGGWTKTDLPLSGSDLIFDIPIT